MGAKPANTLKSRPAPSPRVHGAEATPGAIRGAAPFGGFDWEAWYASVGGRRPRPAAFADFWREMETEQLPHARGPAASTRADLGDPVAAREAVKGLAVRAGADAVGVARVTPADVYRGKSVAEPFAVVVARRMRLADLATAPSEQAAVEMGRVYRDVGSTVTRLARDLRSLGFEATVQHPVLDMDVLFLPLAERAGVGELGRHGSLINPRLGPMFRLGAVTTDAPMATDAPVDLGISRFCDNCRACRDACPPDAIPEARGDPAGGSRYVVDTDKCFPYFAANHYCGACLAVCPFNSESFGALFLAGKAPVPKRPAIVVRAARRADVSRPA